MKKPRWTQTRFPALEVRWTEDIFNQGNGTLEGRITHVDRSIEEHVMLPVPKRYYQQLLSIPEPVTLYNQILTMYL